MLMIDVVEEYKLTACSEACSEQRRKKVPKRLFVSCRRVIEEELERTSTGTHRVIFGGRERGSGPFNFTVDVMGVS